MSYSTIYADSLKAYENGQNITNSIQKKVDNIAENEVLFGNVNYSGGYDSVINSFESASGASGTNGANGNNGSNGADGSNGANGANGANGSAAVPQTAGDAIFGTNECTDGKDDGKIGFWEGCKSFFKGIGKTVVNTVVGIVTDPKKLLLTAGAVALAIVCPPAGVAMAVAGGVAGAVKVGKGIHNAATATTDAAKKSALEDVGGGTLQVGLSAVGAKAGIKAMKTTSGSAMQAAAKAGEKGLGTTVKAFGKDVVTGGRGAKFDTFGAAVKGTGKSWTNNSSNAGGYLLTKGVSNVAGNIKYNGVLKGSAKTVTDAGSGIKTKYSDAKLTRQANKQASKTGKMSRDAQKEIQDIQKQLENPKLSDTARADLNKQLKIAQEKVNGYETTLQRAQAKTDGNIKSLESDLAQAKSVAKKLPNNEAAQAKVRLLEKQLSSEKAISTANQAATKAYQQSQAQIAKAQTTLDAAKLALKKLPKNATKEQIAAAEKAVSEARTALQTAKTAAPDTNIATQALKAANEQAKVAGYEGQGYRPFLGATLGPIVYEME